MPRSRISKDDGATLGAVPAADFQTVSALFDDEKWNLRRYRWTMLASAFFYSSWGLVWSYFLAGQFNDPMWHRLVVSAMCLAFVGLTYRPGVLRPYLSPLFTAVVCAISAHAFSLALNNDLNYTYVLGAYCVMFASGSCLLSSRALATYIAFSALVTGAIWLNRYDLLSFTFFLGAVSSSVVSFGTSKLVLSLLAELRRSGQALERESGKLGRANRELGNVMNSLSQGFFSFGRDGLCAHSHSRACLDLLEMSPAGRPVSTVLARDEAGRRSVEEWFELTFSAVPNLRETLLEAGPPTIAHSRGLHVGLRYYPVVENDVLIEIVVVASDLTNELRARRAADLERRRIAVIASLVEQRAVFQPFWIDVRERLHFFRTVAPTNADPATRVAFNRFLHTVKGGFAMFQLLDLAEATHGLESARAGGRGDVGGVSVSASAGQLQKLVDAFNDEFAPILGAALTARERTIDLPLGRALELIDLAEDPARLETLRRNLATIVRRPIGEHFHSFQILARDLAERQGKLLEPVELRRGDLLIFPEAPREVLAAFVHVFRNAVDHGLEPPDERRAAGKPPAGRVVVEFEIASRDGRDWLNIAVIDDGRGIDPSRVRAKAERLGIGATGASDHDVIQLVFDANFTTRDEVSDLSGRGIGLNALKASVEAAGGSVAVASTVGRGTRLSVSVPA